MKRRIKEVIPLFVLRTAIGWLFFHEGISKLWQPGWTAHYYLSHSDGPLHSFFEWLIVTPGLMDYVDYGMIGILLVIGLSLMTGAYERWAAIGGVILLFLFYLSYPPVIGIENKQTEGNYLFVDKNLIIACALWVIYRFQPGLQIGMDYLIHNKRSSINTSNKV